jgi:hypothetical protein
MDLQGPSAQELRLNILALDFEEACQASEELCRVRVARSQLGLPDFQGPPQQWLRLSIPSFYLQDTCSAVKKCRPTTGLLQGHIDSSIRGYTFNHLQLLKAGTIRLCNMCAKRCNLRQNLLPVTYPEWDSCTCSFLRGCLFDGIPVMVKILLQEALGS